MTDATFDPAIEVFSTCPPSSEVTGGEYRRRAVEVARWSEAAGCRGILVYSDNRLLDPWLVAQLIVQHTTALTPLVAVQPAYMHPYAVAKLVASIADLHGRRIDLNMIAGGFRNDLAALDDRVPHDARYDRLVEYTAIVRDLLSSPGPVSRRGAFYAVDHLRLAPTPPPELRPEIFVSASSDAGLAAARTLGATAVKYPRAPGEETPARRETPHGVRVGVVARATDAEAWRIAHARFPEDRRGQLTHQLAMKTSDSAWHRQLSDPDADVVDGVYWLGPFRNYQTFCPYLVGAYERIGEALAVYLEAGYTRFILDVPPDAEELRHVARGFRHALGAAR